MKKDSFSRKKAYHAPKPKNIKNTAGMRPAAVKDTAKADKSLPADSAVRPEQLYLLAKQQKRIAVIGAGASGMMAAISAAEAAEGSGSAVQIVLLEKASRPGKKLLASGNGRCNLSNKDLTPAHYVTHDPARLAKIMETCSCGSADLLLQKLGLVCSEPEDGRIYPWCEQASAVLDVLRAALDRLQVILLCNCPVSSLTPLGEGFTVGVAGTGENSTASQPFQFTADAVILAAGGAAAPGLGGGTDGYSLAEKAGHTLIPTVPGLTALRCSLPYTEPGGRFADLLPGLKGVRCKAEATLFQRDTPIGKQSGEVQFSDGTLSGIPILQLSLLQDGKADCSLRLNLLPGLSEKELTDLLRQRRSKAGDRTLEELLIGTVHKKLGFAVMKAAGLAPLSRQIGSLTEQELSRLAGLLQNLSLPVNGNCGWEGAQTTRGGIALSEVDDRCNSLMHPGLFFTGEVLDVAGQCGGYNLDWAFCTGFHAGAAAFGQLHTK